jgi:hypothetical protein
MNSLYMVLDGSCGYKSCKARPDDRDLDRTKSLCGSCDCSIDALNYSESVNYNWRGSFMFVAPTPMYIDFTEY